MKETRDKGFTLIELLAVIVILAIIALIATPIIVGVINKSKKNAFMDTAYGVVEAGKLYYAKNFGNDDFTGRTFAFPADAEDLKLSGEKIGGGSLEVTSKGKQVLAIYDKGKNWCASKGEEDSKITVEKYEDGKCGTSTESNIEFDVAKGVNKPVLSTGMVPVVWNGTEFIDTTKDDPNWYDYEAQKWANARTTDGSYWVWIPRYAYKITGGYHSSTTGNIDVKFLKGTSNETIDGTVVETSGYEVGIKDTSMHYFLQPAFEFGSSMTGFWMAKYEPTAEEGISSNLSCDASDNVTTKTVKIVPNTLSWRCIEIGNAYTVSKEMKSKSVYGWKANEVDTHLIKNTEWGAVAYLSKSKYGVYNEEIWANIYSGFKTGCSGSKPGGSSETICVTYNTTNGQKASTTHNIYGVYDMAGGAEEMIAAYINNDDGNLTLYGATLNNEPNKKYKNLYSVGNPDTRFNNYEVNKNTYGDALYETSGNGDSATGSWYGDYSYMPSTPSPFFKRGGYYSSGSNAGPFASRVADGAPAKQNTFSFRPVIFVGK